MSWALHTRVHPAGEIVEALAHTTPRAHISDDQLEQAHSAKEAAIDLIQSGTVGNPEKDAYIVSVSGHAGEGAEDSVTVTVTVAPSGDE